MPSSLLATFIRLITGVNARWVDAAPAEGYDPGQLPQRIYYANHQSNLDAPVIWAALPTALRKRTRPVAAQDYWDATALRRRIARNGFNALLIERKKVTKTNNPLTAMEAALEAGDSLILFPEGTRSEAEDEEHSVGEFKSGLYHLARKFPSVQLVPVYLENLSRILPKGELILVPLLAAARFGAPLARVDDEGKGPFLDRARLALIALEETER
jgi:1-acyl-sn-glycerol-3-phosphate acyltransferase